MRTWRDGGREVGGARLRRVDADGQRDAAALEARERVHHRVAGRLLVEHLAGARGQHDGPQATEDDRGVGVRAVDLLRDACELEGERPLEHARRRRDVRAEDTHAEPAEAAQRADAAALVERELHGRVPVRLHAEVDRAQRPLVPGGGEGHGHLGERAGAALELRASLAGSQAADVDAVDLDAGGDLARRAGEDEPEHGSAHRGDDREHHQPLNAAAFWNGCDADRGPGPDQSLPRRARHGV